MKPKVVFIHQPIGNQWKDLKGKYNIVIRKERKISRDELLRFVKGADVIVSSLTEKIDEEVMDAAGECLKVICNYAVGFDNIDLQAATQRGVVVTNTPGVLTEAVAEHVLALALAVSRRIVEGDRFVRAGKYKGWEPDLLIGTGLRGKVMGIVGLGRIGRWIARIAVGLGMKVVYFSKEKDPEMELASGIMYRNLHQLLSISDVISLNVPLNDETREMIGEEQLKLMKKTAVLINTARGRVVDEEALIKTLKEGKIAGAGLDVFDDENHVDPRFYKLPNVVLTPHVASATVEARVAMTDMVIQGFTHALGGIKPDNIVNQEVWEKRRRR